MNRSTVASHSTKRGSSSSPTRSAKLANREPANSSAFARPGVAGAARATTSRVNAAAAADTETGA